MKRTFTIFALLYFGFITYSQNESFDGVYNIYNTNYPIPKFIKSEKIEKISIVSFGYHIENQDTVIDSEMRQIDLSYPVEYHFNADGNIIQIVAIDFWQKDSAIIDTIKVFKYDAFGRITEETEIGSSTQSFSKITYVYNENSSSLVLKELHLIRGPNAFNSSYYRYRDGLRSDSVLSWSCNYDNTICGEKTIYVSHYYNPNDQIKKVVTVYETTRNKDGIIKLVGKFGGKYSYFFSEKGQLIQIIEVWKTDKSINYAFEPPRKNYLITEFIYNPNGTINRIYKKHKLENIEKIVETQFTYHY